MAPLPVPPSLAGLSRRLSAGASIASAPRLTSARGGFPGGTWTVDLRYRCGCVRRLSLRPDGRWASQFGNSPAACGPDCHFARTAARSARRREIRESLRAADGARWLAARAEDARQAELWRNWNPGGRK